jgi:hypothetical protein
MFDKDKIMKLAIEAGRKALIRQMQAVKAKMGDEGRDIRIDPVKSVVVKGDQVHLGQVDFPSEAVRAKFLELLEQ